MFDTRASLAWALASPPIADSKSAAVVNARVEAIAFAQRAFDAAMATAKEHYEHSMTQAVLRGRAK